MKGSSNLTSPSKKTPQKSLITSFFKKPTSIAPPPSLTATYTAPVEQPNNNRLDDAISISSSISSSSNEDMMMVDVVNQQLAAIIPSPVEMLSSQSSNQFIDSSSCDSDDVTVGSLFQLKQGSPLITYDKSSNLKKRKIDLSSDEDEKEQPVTTTTQNTLEEKKENVDPNIKSPKKKKTKASHSTTPSKALTPSVSTPSVASLPVPSSDEPASEEEIDQKIAQLENEVKQTKPDLSNSKKIRKDEKIQKSLTKFIEYCATNKDFKNGNKSTFPVKPKFIVLLIAFCQGSPLELDELVADIRKSFRKASKKKDRVKITEDDLPTVDAFKNAINLQMERKSYGVKDLCEIAVWECRKLSTLTSKLGSSSIKETITMDKNIRSNFKKIVDTKAKEITKLRKTKAKLEKAAAKKTTSKKNVQSSGAQPASSQVLTSPKKRAPQTSVKSKSITLFTQKCNILQKDQIVSAPVCRVQETKNIEEMDMAIAGQNHATSLSSIILDLKRFKRPTKKVQFKFISMNGKRRFIDKKDEECKSTVVSGRKPFAKDPSVSYPEEESDDDDDVMMVDGDDMVLGELEPEDGESLEEDSDNDEVDFDEEDETMDDTICADDVIEYEDGNVEHVEVAPKEQKKKKKGLVEIDPPLFEYTNQLQDTCFVVDDEFDIADLNCNQVYWWIGKKEEKKDDAKMDSSSDAVTEGKMDLKFVDQSSPLNTSISEMKEDKWEEDVMSFFKTTLHSSSSKSDIVKAFTEKYPSYSKNRVNKKIKEMVVKEKRQGDSKQKFYIKQ